MEDTKGHTALMDSRTQWIVQVTYCTDELWEEDTGAGQLGFCPRQTPLWDCFVVWGEVGVQEVSKIVFLHILYCIPWPLQL